MRIFDQVTERLGAAGAVARSGVLAPIRPDRAVRMAREAGRWGPTPPAAVALSAVRHPRRTAVIDERGSLTWAQLEARTNAMARGLAARGVGPGATVGLLCRNHRGFVEGLVAAGKTGADVVLLNTGFAGPQLGDVARREGVSVLVHDEAFAAEVRAAGLTDTMTRVVTWATSRGPGGPTLDSLVAGSSEAPVPAPDQPGQVVLLSSGTTGTPKGAKRQLDREALRGSSSALGLVARIPFRAGDPTLISAPLFHTWGLSNLLLAATFSSPMVLREHFDPLDALAAVQHHRVRALVAVPAMLQRILDIPERDRAPIDTSSLRLVALSGSALPGGLATRWMDAFGDHLYSLYGSTEVAAVAIAGPADLRRAPDTAGPLLPGISVRLLDEDGREVPAGARGRIFVRSGMLFDGYTGGGGKEVLDGYMSSGDLGRFDAEGCLYVEGREDDMIVSGGENVVPHEIEEVIASLPGVAEAVVVGVPDERFGQRLRAVVVPEPGVELTAEEVRAWVRDHLARFKVPRDVVIVAELPRNTTGKVLRRVLADEASD